MKCPNPDCSRTAADKVIDSRHNKGENMIRRRRECVCGHRFTTYELIAATPPHFQQLPADLDVDDPIALLTRTIRLIVTGGKIPHEASEPRPDRQPHAAGSDGPANEIMASTPGSSGGIGQHGTGG